MPNDIIQQFLDKPEEVETASGPDVIQQFLDQPEESSPTLNAPTSNDDVIQRFLARPEQAPPTPQAEALRKTLGVRHGATRTWEEPSKTSAFLRPLLEGAGPAAAATAAGLKTAALLSPSAAVTGGIPVIPAVGGSLAAILTYALAKKGVKLGREAVMGKEATAQYEQETQAAQEAHPVIGGMGEMLGQAPLLATGKGLPQAATRIGKIAQSALQGATFSGASEAGRMSTGERDATLLSVMEQMAKGGITFAPMAFIPHAKTLLGAMGWKAPSDAAAMTVASALYDTVVHGKPMNAKKLGEEFAQTVPAFVMMNLLTSLGHMPAIPTRRAARPAEEVVPEALPIAEEVPPEPVIPVAEPRPVEPVPVEQVVKPPEPAPPPQAEAQTPVEQVKVEGASPDLLRSGNRVNITQMEGGGTYTVERVNPDGTVDVRDETNRPMQVRRERIYPVAEKEPTQPPGVAGATGTPETAPPALTPEVAKEPSQMTKAEWTEHLQRGTWADFADPELTAQRQILADAMKAAKTEKKQRAALGEVESIRKVMTDRNGALQRNAERRAADKVVEKAELVQRHAGNKEAGMATHEAFIKRAIRRGDSIPDEVLADYPDLKPDGAKMVADKAQAELDRAEAAKAQPDLFAPEQIISDARAASPKNVRKVLNEQATALEVETKGTNQQVAKRISDALAAQGPRTGEGPGTPAAEGREFWPGTSTQKAYLLEMTERIGTRLLPHERRRWTVAIDEAASKLQGDPEAGAKLVARLQEEPTHVPNDADNMLLTMEMIERQKVRNDAYSALHETEGSTDKSALAFAKNKAVEAQQALERAYEVADRGGTEAGRALAARKAIMADDFTLVSLERQARTVKGKPLSPEEVAELKAQADAYAKANEELQKRLAELEKKQAEKETQAKAGDEAKSMKDLENKARRKGGEDVRKGKPLDLEGDKQAAIDKIEELLESEGDITLKDLQNPIDELALHFERKNIAENKGKSTLTHEKLVEQVHGILRKYLPDVTLSEVGRVVAHYGDATWPDTKDAAKVALRGHRQERLKVAALEIVQKNIAALNAKAAKTAADLEIAEKTGPQRDLMTRIAADLQKQVNNAMKEQDRLMQELGIEKPDSAEALRSKLDAKESRLQNRLADLKRALEEHKRLTKTTATPLENEKTKALEAEIEQKTAEYEEMFPLEAKVPKTNAERVADAKQRVQENMSRIREQIANRQREVQKTQKPLNEDAELIRMHEEEGALNALLDKYLPKERDPYADAKKNDADEQRLTREIEDLNKQINDKERKPRILQKKTDTAEIARLKGVRDARRAVLDIMFPRLVTEQQRLDRALSAAKRQAENAEDQLQRAQKGDFAGKPKPTSQLWSKELGELKLKAQAARLEVQRLKDLAFPPLTPEQQAVKQYKARLDRMIAEGEDRIRRGDFAPKARKETDISGDPDALQKQARVAEIRNEIKAGRERLRWQQLDIVEKAGEVMLAGYDLTRNVAYSADDSLLGRQGWFYLFSHPLKWTQLVMPSLKGMSFAQSRKFGQQHLERDNHRTGIDKVTKVEFNEPDGTGRYSKVEDMVFRRNLLRNLPRVGRAVDVASLPLDVSNNMFATASNIMRGTFQDLLIANTRMGREIMRNPRNLTAQQRQFLVDIGWGVNVLTGRGPMKHAEGASRALGAPRFIKAAFGTMFFRPILHAKTPEAKMVFARQYARAAITLGAIYSAAYWYLDDGDKVEWDPRSSKVGAIKLWGNFLWNPLAVIAPQLRILARLISGQKKVGDKIINLRQHVLPFATEAQRAQKVPYGEGIWKEVGRYTRSKLHPGLNLVGGLAAGEDYYGRTQTPLQAILGGLTPLTPGQTWEAYSLEGPVSATAISAGQFFGFGVSPDYDKPEVRDYFMPKETSPLKLPSNPLTRSRLKKSNYGAPIQ